jgi:D-arabinan exo alpha-(1,3)/(1,5)-arabinofuranosidase (non-reducing end)
LGSSLTSAPKGECTHGSGAIQHVWLTVHPSHWRKLVIRCYWDGEATPSVEVPLGDFFGNGWWGEGEIKFYMDGDVDFPTICGTGREDYFGGAWNFEHPAGQYGVFSSPYSGLPQVIKPDDLYQSQQRFGMYRWHIMDPIRFQHNLRVTIQALGWRVGQGYLPLKDDIASTVFWYQTEPHAPFPALPSDEALEVI